MTVARSVSEVLGEHVSLEIESIDRLYLNLYVPILQRPEGTAHFWIRHRGHRFASSALMAPIRAAHRQTARLEAQEVVQLGIGPDAHEAGHTAMVSQGAAASNQNPLATWATSNDRPTVGL